MYSSNNSGNQNHGNPSTNSHGTNYYGSSPHHHTTPSPQQQQPPPLPPKDAVYPSNRNYRYANGNPTSNAHLAELSSSPSKAQHQNASYLTHSNVISDPFYEASSSPMLSDVPQLPPKPTQYKTVLHSANNGYSYKLPHPASPIYLYGTQNTVGLSQTNINNTTTAYIPHHSATSSSDLQHFPQDVTSHPQQQYAQYINSFNSSPVTPTKIHTSTSPGRAPASSATNGSSPLYSAGSSNSSPYGNSQSHSRSPMPLRVDTSSRAGSPSKMSSSAYGSYSQSSSQQSTPLDRKPLGPRLPPSGFASISSAVSQTSPQHRPNSSQPHTPSRPTHRHTRSHGAALSSPSSSSSHGYSNSLGNLHSASPTSNITPSVLEDPYRFQSFDQCSMVSNSPTSPIKRKDVTSTTTQVQMQAQAQAPAQAQAQAQLNLPVISNAGHHHSHHHHHNHHHHHAYSKSAGSIPTNTTNLSPPQQSNLSRQKSTESSYETDVLNSSGHSGKSAFSSYSNVSSYSSNSYTSPSPLHAHPQDQPLFKNNNLAYPDSLPYPDELPLSSSPPKEDSRRAIIEGFANFAINGTGSAPLDSSSTISGDTIKPDFRMHRSQTFTDVVEDNDLLPPPNRSYSVFSKPVAYSKSSLRSATSLSTATDDNSLMLKLDLPSIPDSRAQLDPEKLSSRDFAVCETPWAISSLCMWVEHLNSKAEMTYETLSEALINLFRHTIPTLGWVAAERVTVPLLESLTACKFLSISQGTSVVILNPYYAISGVLPSITGSGCYSPKSHEFDQKSKDNSCVYRCYSSRCSKTIPYKPILPAMDVAQKLNDNDRVNWAKIWGILDEDLAKMDKKVIERQCAIQEFIGTEEIYVRGLKAFLNVYGDYLARARPHVVHGQQKFWSDTFGCIQGLIESNDNQLLTYLKIRQAQQGPYINTIADLVLNWLKVARTPYLIRASTYSYAMRVVSSEKSKKNELFAAWLDKAEHDPRLTRQQKFDFLMSSPFMRLCRYNLLFERIRASTPHDDPEYRMWERCVEECRAIVEEYNRLYGESEDVSSIMTLEERIQFPNLEEKVDLKLREPRRKIFYQGDVLRKGEFGIDYVDTHMILLDNYLILAKIKKDNLEKYLVTKRPIPLDLLVIEQADGEPVVKSNTKMITGVLSGNSHDSKRQAKNNAGNSASGNGTSNNSNGTSNGGSGSPVESGGFSGNLIHDNENAIYPIKLRDLGATGNHARKAYYYLYTQTEEERKAWVAKMLQAKREYSSAAYAHNAEPFRVRIVEDRFFGYENSDAPKLAVYAEANALDRGIKEYESVNGPTRIGSSITATSQINCVVTCSLGGKYFTVVGLENGIYACDMTIKKVPPSVLTNSTPKNPYKNSISGDPKSSKGLGSILEDKVPANEETVTWTAPQWVRVLDLQKVTQLEVLVDYNVLLVLSDRTLVYYPLDQILAIVLNNNRKPRDPNMAGYAISKPKEVGFFTTGYMSSGGAGITADSKRQLLFYSGKKRILKDPREAMKKGGGSTIIEVVEPIKERGSQKKRSHFVVQLTKSSDSSVVDGSLNGGAPARTGSGPSKVGTSASSTEYFREYDSVTLASDSYGMTLFGSTFFVHTAKGFELLALSYKIPKVVPEPASISHALNRAMMSAGRTDGSVGGGTSNGNLPSTSGRNGSVSASSGSAGYPSLTPQALSESVKRKLEGSKPVGAFMINDNCILLVYEQVAIFVDKFGEMSSPIVINMLSKVKSALVSYPYLLAFSDEIVEVRKMDVGSAGGGAAASRKAKRVAAAAMKSSTQSGGVADTSPFSRANLQASDYSSCELKQVITGKNIRLVVDGSKRSKQGQEVMVSMAHPKYSNQQLIIELVTNEFVVDDDNSSLVGL